MNKEEKYEAVPIWNRILLTLDEAASYTGIGINRIRRMTREPNCEFVIYVGERRMIKRKKFDEYLESQYKM